MTTTPESFAISPDGKQIAFVASEGGQQLHIRALSSQLAQPLPGSEGASFPFWSADSRSIAFFAEGSLKRLDLGGGLPRTLAPAPRGQGGAWGDGVIVWAGLSGYHPQYDIAPDGRFLINVTEEKAAASTITIVLNWKAPPRLN